MKKLLLFLLVLSRFGASAQNLDTVLVRNLTLQAGDYAYVIGENVQYINKDSTTAREFRRIRDRIRTANPATFSTSVTIDSIPGYVVLSFYLTVKSARAGVIAARYAAITSAIEAKTNMTPFLTPYNNAYSNDYSNSRDLGKHVVMDN